MRLRLVAVTAALLALALVIGSGAFDAVSADRGAVVDVAGDADALLGLTPYDGPTGAFAYLEAGVLVVDLSGASPNVDTEEGPIYGATGVTARAVTRIDDVFTVANHGTVPVCVWLTEDSSTVSVYATTEDHGGVQTPGAAFGLRPGQAVDIGLAIDARTAAVDERLLDGMTVHADADVDCGIAEGGD